MGGRGGQYMGRGILSGRPKRFIVKSVGEGAKDGRDGGG